MIILIFIGVVILHVFATNNEIEVMKLSDFPNNLKIALHMPCVESNVFATKCMCHIKCTDELCNNAINLCTKYSERSDIFYYFIILLTL